MLERLIERLWQRAGVPPRQCPGHRARDGSWLPPERQLGFLGTQVAAVLEQAAALDRKQRRAADHQLGAELLGREPGVRGGHGRRGCRGGGSVGRYPRGVQAAFARVLEVGLSGEQRPADDL